MEKREKSKMQDQSSTAITYCPSFSSYSSVKIAEIAADTVAREEDETEDDEEEFEFVLVRASPGVDSATLANKNGSEAYFRPVFPLFNRDLVIDDYEEVERQMRIPLNKMFIGDDRDPASSESDEPEGLQERKFCLWTLSPSPSPLRSPAASPARCQKSSSQGASSSKRRWRLRDLLRRCSSDGRQSLVLLTPKSDNFKEDAKPEKNEKTKPKPLSPAKPAAKQKVSAHEVFYVRNKALKEGDKRKSYLPYRRDLVGFFSNFNGFSKNFVPF